MKYFTSDQHFFHQNILNLVPLRKQYLENQGLPITVESMNQVLINQWNKVVHKNDVVYELGDFCLSTHTKDLDAILSQLNGKIKFVQGNHDSNHSYDHLRSNGYNIRYMGFHFRDHGIDYFLTHYPTQVDYRVNLYDSKPIKRINIHGHIHDAEGIKVGDALDYDDSWMDGVERPVYNLTNYNVCVDSPNVIEFGTPISFEQIKEEMGLLDD